MSLASSCLVANLQIGVAAGADKAIVAAGAKVRNHFYVNTLDWKHNGDRLLPCKNFVEFMGGHLALRKEFAGLLISVGSDAADKFYVRLDIDPVPGHPESVGYVELAAGVYAQLTARIAKAMKVREARATADLWSRLIDPLTHFAETMESDRAFRDATIRNLAEAVELLPRLNFADDADLDAAIAAVKEMIAFFPVKSLRKQDGVRAAAGRDARKTLTEIEKIRV
jgi:hypothetical protein